MYWLLRTPPVGQVTKEDIETLFGKKSKLLGWFGARRLGKPDKRTQFGQGARRVGKQSTVRADRS